MQDTKKTEVLNKIKLVFETDYENNPMVVSFYDLIRIYYDMEKKCNYTEQIKQIVTEAIDWPFSSCDACFIEENNEMLLCITIKMEKTNENDGLSYQYVFKKEDEKLDLIRYSGVYLPLRYQILRVLLTQAYPLLLLEYERLDYTHSDDSEFFYVEGNGFKTSIKGNEKEFLISLGTDTAFEKNKIKENSVAILFDHEQNYLCETSSKDVADLLFGHEEDFFRKFYISIDQLPEFVKKQLKEQKIENVENKVVEEKSLFKKIQQFFYKK